MPELPEVETIRRGLEKCILGEKIRKVKIDEPKSLIGEVKRVEGARVKELDRRGKALMIRLDNGEVMMIHLRMTGQLIWVGEERFAGGHPNENFVEELPNKQTRVEIECEKGKLFFNDQRKFGFIKILREGEVERDSFIRKLAKEPWEMKAGEFEKNLQKHKNSAVKAVILDQGVICGLGNIYADEALHEAGIDPRRKAGSLGLEEVEKLLEGARTVMERSLEAGGSTIKNYVKADGTRGDYLDLFAEVYGREGEKCRRCGEKIVKIKIGGRGTHYCPKCQK